MFSAVQCTRTLPRRRNILQRICRDLLSLVIINCKSLQTDWPGSGLTLDSSGDPDSDSARPDGARCHLVIWEKLAPVIIQSLLSCNFLLTGTLVQMVIRQKVTKISKDHPSDFIDLTDQIFSMVSRELTGWVSLKLYGGIMSAHMCLHSLLWTRPNGHKMLPYLEIYTCQGQKLL